MRTPESVLAAIVKLLHPLPHKEQTAVLGALTYTYATANDVADWRTKR